MAPAARATAKKDLDKINKILDESVKVYDEAVAIMEKLGLDFTK